MKFILPFILAASVCWANSVTLFNDSIYSLKANLYAYDGRLLGQYVLTPRDSAEWNNEYTGMGTPEYNESETPYTVNWYCLSGTPYSSCSDVAAGSVVTAQSCTGPKECSEQPSKEYKMYRPQPNP